MSATRLPRPHPAAAVLHELQAGLRDPANHYLVNTTFFSTQDGPVLLGALYLHRDAVWNLTVAGEHFSCDVLLTPRQRHRVQVAYGQIWQILRGNGPQFDAADEAGILYDNAAALTDFARHGLAE